MPIKLSHLQLLVNKYMNLSSSFCFFSSKIDGCYKNNMAISFKS